MESSRVPCSRRGILGADMAQVEEDVAVYPATFVDLVQPGGR